GALDGVFRAPQVNEPLPLRRPLPHPGRGLVLVPTRGALGWGVQGTAGQRAVPAPAAAPAPAPASSPAPTPGAGARCARRPGVPWMGCSGHRRSAARTRTAARTHTRGRGPVRASTWGALDGAFRAPQV